MQKKWIGLSFFLVLIFLVWSYATVIRKISSVPLSSWTIDKTTDCAVVLTGGPNRIQEGMSLLSQKKIRKLIISGVHPGASLREIFPLWPLYGALKPTHVILEKYSKTTYGNAQQSLQLVEALQCRDITLITSRLHMYRAYRTFKAIFPENIEVTQRSVVAGTFQFSISDLFVEATKSLFYSIWAY